MVITPLVQINRYGFTYLVSIESFYSFAKEDRPLTSLYYNLQIEVCIRHVPTSVHLRLHGGVAFFARRSCGPGLPKCAGSSSGAMKRSERTKWCAARSSQYFAYHPRLLPLCPLTRLTAEVGGVPAQAKAVTHAIRHTSRGTAKTIGQFSSCINALVVFWLLWADLSNSW